MSTSGEFTSLTLKLRSPRRIVDGNVRSAVLQCAAVSTKSSEIKEPPHLNESSPLKSGYPMLHLRRIVKFQTVKTLKMDNTFKFTQPCAGSR